VERPVEPGCHRWDLLAEPEAQHAATSNLSLLPELDDASSLVSLERGNGFAAALTFCAGARTLAGFRFVGAPPNGRLWLLASRFALPEGLPEAWGSGGRARMAALLRRQQVRVVGSPIEQALGLQGPTLLPLRLEPGACYVAALAPVRGQAFSLALGARGVGISSQNHSVGDEGTLLTFCSPRAEAVALEADSRGAGLTWLFALWQVGRVRVGDEVPP
jgi:hypothetical protein